MGRNRRLAHTEVCVEVVALTLRAWYSIGTLGIESHAVRIAEGSGERSGTGRHHGVMSYGRRGLLQYTPVVVVHWSRVVCDADGSSVRHCCMVRTRSGKNAGLVLAIDRSAYVGIAVVWSTGDNIFVQG
jgi:hypothetical protein